MPKGIPGSSTPCKMDGCSEPARGHGLCAMHYARERRTGNPGPAGKKNHPLPSECIVDGCPEIPKARGLCEAHWSRWYRDGDPGPAEIKRPRERCDVPDCPQPHVGLGFCQSHLRKFHLYGDPEHTEHPGRWAGDEVGYHGAHYRLRKLRGNATEHACRRCGGEADEWAYDHADPDERQDPKRGPYSLDPDHYMPLCHSCHRAMDLAPERPWRRGDS